MIMLLSFTVSQAARRTSRLGDILEKLVASMGLHQGANTSACVLMKTRRREQVKGVSLA
jgi:hypothetical protein